MRKVVLAALAGCVYGALTAAERVPLVENGVAKASVVLPAGAAPFETFMASELTNYLFKATGARLRVAVAPIDGLVPIRFEVVRPAADDGLRNDGFRLEVSAREIRISAHEPQGVVFGVYYVLNRYAGVCWFHLESGDDVEPRKTVTLPSGVLVKDPGRLHSGAFAGDVHIPAVSEYVQVWNARNGFTTAWAADERLGTKMINQGGGHVFGNLLLETPIDEAELKAMEQEVRDKESDVFLAGAKVRPAEVTRYARWKCLVRCHPNWFGLVNGRRVPCGAGMRGVTKLGTSMPCLTNPEMRRQLVANFKTWRKTVPDGTKIRWTLYCDDCGQWCECPNCLKYLKTTGAAHRDDKASDVWWLLVNDFAKGVLSPDDPDVTLGVGVYRDFRVFPEKVKPVPRPGMSVVVCTHGRDYLYSLTNGFWKENAPYRKMVEDWAKVGLRVDTFEYMNQTPGKCNYIFWERAWVEDLKWYRANDIACASWGVGPWNGFKAEPTYFRRNAAKARWQITWLTGHFLWDPEDDFETVRNEMLRRYYRAAAVPMTAYHKLLEQAIYSTGLGMRYLAEGSDSELIPAAAGQKGVMRKARRCLKEAIALASGDEELVRRISRDRDWFHTNWETVGVVDDPASVHTVPRTPRQETLDGVTASYDDDALYLKPIDPAEPVCLRTTMMGSRYWRIAVGKDGRTQSDLLGEPVPGDKTKPLAFVSKNGIYRIPFDQFGPLNRNELWTIKAGSPEGGVQRSFGVFGNAIWNPSFETVGPFVPKGENGVGWELSTAEMPTRWVFCSCGAGKGGLVRESAPDGKVFVHVASKTKESAAYLMSYLAFYPKTAERVRVAFQARGKAELTVVPLAKGCARTPVSVDAKDWRRYETFFDLNGEHPNLVQFKIVGELDLDAFEYVPLPVEQGEMERLFNGRDLTGWYPVLEKRRKGEDPNRIFTVKDGLLCVSGEETGGITTERNFRDYRLVVEYRWTGKGIGSRKGMAADSGVLYHSQGKDLAWHGTWMRSFECNILRGRTGDFVIVSTKDSPIRYEAEIAGKTHVNECNLPNDFARKDWKNVEETPDVSPERPFGEWNTIEIVCRGDAVEHWLNGVKVFEARRLTPSEGRLQIQSEGHPIEFRRIDLYHLMD